MQHLHNIMSSSQNVKDEPKIAGRKPSVDEKKKLLKMGLQMEKITFDKLRRKIMEIK